MSRPTFGTKENHHVVLGFSLFCGRAIGWSVWLLWPGGRSGGDREDSVLRVLGPVHCQLADWNAAQRHDLRIDRLSAKVTFRKPGRKGTRIGKVFGDTIAFPGFLTFLVW